MSKEAIMKTAGSQQEVMTINGIPVYSKRFDFDGCHITYLCETVEDKHGWVRYPLWPDHAGNFVEDLDIIHFLCGSYLYEHKQQGGRCYVRRVE